MTNLRVFVFIIITFLFYSCEDKNSYDYKKCSFLKAKQLLYNTDHFLEPEFFKFSTFDSNKVNIQNNIIKSIVFDDCLKDFYSEIKISSDTTFAEILFQTYFYTSKYSQKAKLSLPDSVVLHHLIFYRNEVCKENFVSYDFVTKKQ